MPARDGTGPTGQGSRTGRGMGFCNSMGVNTNQPLGFILNRSFNNAGRMWNNTFGRLFGRRRGKRMNWRS